MFSLTKMSILSSSINLVDFFKSEAVKSRKTSKPNSDFPINAPNAIAIGRPIMLVRGFLHPLHF